MKVFNFHTLLPTSMVILSMSATMAIDLGYAANRMLPNMIVSTVWALNLQFDVNEPIN